MKDRASLKLLSLFWIFNLGFFFLSSFVQDNPNSGVGYLDLPKDQSIVCASGQLKKSAPRSIEDKSLLFAFGASTHINFKWAGPLEDLRVNVRKSFIGLNKTLLSEKKFFLSSQSPRGPPSLFS